MKKRYPDNASTTFPKSEAAAQAVYTYMAQVGCNINRGCYDSACNVEEQVPETTIGALEEICHGL